MTTFLSHIEEELDSRRKEGAFRTLNTLSTFTDFSSNDFLGFGKTKVYQKGISELSPELFEYQPGSRLLTGNSIHHMDFEEYLARVHEGEATLLFQSGYQANLGLLECLGMNKKVTIIFDSLSHASIRHGIQHVKGNTYKFKNNDLSDLERLLKKVENQTWVVVESIYSMTGKKAPLPEIAALCKKYNAGLVIDEAHAFGVFGKDGLGLSFDLKLDIPWIKIITFGKALALNGAAVISGNLMKNAMINLARPFIYTTSFPPFMIGLMLFGHETMIAMEKERLNWRKRFGKLNIQGDTHIKFIKTGSNISAKKLSEKFYNNGMDIRPIMHPTVAKGEEGCRIVDHIFNTEAEIEILNSTI